MPMRVFDFRVDSRAGALADAFETGSSGAGASERSAGGAFAAILLCVALASGAAHAQERPTIETLDARLARVERVMDQSLLDQLQRIDSLQQELRELRGELETLQYELDKQRRRGDDLYGDTDQRLTDLEEARDAGSPFYDEDGLEGLGETDGRDRGGAGGATNGASGGEASATGAGGGDAMDEPVAVFVPEGGRSGGAGDGAAPPVAGLRDTATRAEKDSYTRAYDLLARGESDAAVDAFDAFLRSFPDGPYSDNAWYWQGEAMYVQRRFEEARRNFGVVVNSFPESTKVPDARLKIGFAFYEEQAFEEARRILSGVQDDYSGRSAAVLARKRLQEMDREGL